MAEVDTSSISSVESAGNGQSPAGSTPRYPTFRISIPDRDTGELREVEFAYSRLTIQSAFAWERQADYFISVLRQWKSLLREVTEKASEATAYAIKKEAKMKGSDE